VSVPTLSPRPAETAPATVAISSTWYQGGGSGRRRQGHDRHASLRPLGGGYARRVSPRRAEGRANVAGAIYGQILVTSFVAALSEVVDVDAGEIFTSLLVTTLVFWLAHVYADAVEQRLEREDPLTSWDVWNIARYEWPGLQAAVPALVALGLGWAGALSTLTAVRLAIALGVVALLAWGFVIARASRLSVLATLGSVALNGAFGLGIVTLKLFVE
jgi:hypothetical protein